MENWRAKSIAGVGGYAHGQNRQFVARTSTVIFCSSFYILHFDVRKLCNFEKRAYTQKKFVRDSNCSSWNAQLRYGEITHHARLYESGRFCLFFVIFPDCVSMGNGTASEIGLLNSFALNAILKVILPSSGAFGMTMRSVIAAGTLGL
jgi:hypothetical protein